MIAVYLLQQNEVIKRLKAAGLTDTGEKFSGDTGDYAIWITSWGEPLMVPEEGPDKMCAEWLLAERLEAILSTNPN
jgi:hypothetical protein